MKIRIENLNVHVNGLDEVSRVVRLLLADNHLTRTKIMDAIERIAQEVAENRTVAESAVTMIQSLRDEVRAVRDEMAQQGQNNERLNALADSLDSQTNALAAALTVNTPQDPNPPVDPTDPADPVQPTDPVVTDPVVDPAQPSDPDAPSPAEDPRFPGPGPDNGPV